MHEEEYELIPLSPIRKMEKRLDRIEKSGTSNEMLRELVEVVKTNQNIVEDIVKVNSEMMAKVSELSNTVSQLTARLNDFMGKIEIVGEAEEHRPASDDIDRKLEKIEKRLNAIALSNIAKMKMPQRPVQQAQRRPMPQAPAF
jgi:DNA repair ATPase RecN